MTHTCNAVNDLNLILRCYQLTIKCFHVDSALQGLIWLCVINYNIIWNKANWLSIKLYRSWLLFPVLASTTCLDYAFVHSIRQLWRLNQMEIVWIDNGLDLYWPHYHIFQLMCIDWTPCRLRNIAVCMYQREHVHWGIGVCVWHHLASWVWSIAVLIRNMA